MQDWKQTRKEINSRLVQLNGLSPETLKGMASLGNAGAKTNYLDAKTRELISLAVAVTTRCNGCIAFHAAEAKKIGVTTEEVSEALGVAINMNAGAALVYSTHVLDAFDKL
ncbi:carboxymuconolactone decarboxylase family protein [Pseudomonas qingdaonensis]|uniref:Carboxymuconolactone decarboxylase family protein n=1 Tax=Pseudomonas qingdaonensis TaxID=2056231 RepID=A0ABX8DLH6_9PSED|nr:carboxymuconolactone decarboxylase family protein [Pseudomonas qingdaonensis]QVL17158.1 carboxymuconolactone decarboxylase family protein [Pseudomonas qingdaonensis]